MLLSADCRDTFLCDFGLSETLDDSGRSTKAFRGELILKSQQYSMTELTMIQLIFVHHMVGFGNKKFP